MQFNWKKCSWGDLATLEYGKALRGYENIESTLYTYPVYGTNGLIGWHDKPLSESPGIIIGRKGAYRGVHYSKIPFFVIDTAFYLRPKFDFDLKWAYYELLTQNINGMDSGSAIPSTSRDAFYKLPVKVPPLLEQRAIAHVLGTLDDKIELNRKMNETLEEMARAIFKSWFIDFDPVHAKAEGRQPYGMNAETATLFPDSFEDSPLGKIPKGWRVTTIRELTNNIQYGLTQSAASEPIGPKFLRITDIQGGRVDWGTVPYCKVSSEEHNRYRLKAGDILVARTGASTGENIYLSVAPDAVFASYLVRFQFADSSYGRLVGAFMRTQDYFDYVAGCIGGSAQPNASAQVLANAHLIVPSDNVARRFAEILDPLDRKISENINESQNLSIIRNSLLPKLLSGKIHVQGVR